MQLNQPNLFSKDHLLSPFADQHLPLKGQTAVITGAAKGIGRACTLTLAQAGADVLIHFHRSDTAAAELVQQCRMFGVRAHSFQANLGRVEETERLAEYAHSTFETVSILVNNAGISYTNLLIDTPFDIWSQMIQTNLTAPFLLSKALLPAMIRQQYGRIINISSIWGQTGGSCEVAYSASKGGLLAMTKALAKEVARAGITVNAVAPGAIETNMIEHLSPEDRVLLADETPIGRIGTVDDVSNVVRFLCLPSSSFITGQVIAPNGGLYT